MFHFRKPALHEPAWTPGEILFFAILGGIALASLMVSLLSRAVGA